MRLCEDGAGRLHRRGDLGQLQQLQQPEQGRLGRLLGPCPTKMS